MSFVSVLGQVGPGEVPGRDMARWQSTAVPTAGRHTAAAHHVGQHRARGREPSERCGGRRQSKEGPLLPSRIPGELGKISVLRATPGAMTPVPVGGDSGAHMM